MNHQDWKSVVFSKKKPVVSKKVVNPKFKSNKSKLNTAKLDEDGNPILKTLPNDFGRKMQAARQAKGWSQKQLGQKLNVKPEIIREYEQGKVVNPNRAFGRKIGRILGADLF